MMGTQATAARFFYNFCLEDLVPKGCAESNRHLDFGGIRTTLTPFYGSTAPLDRPRVDDPHALVGYCLATRSERRSCKEGYLDLDNRWLCRLGLDGKVPSRTKD